MGIFRKLNDNEISELVANLKSLLPRSSQLLNVARLYLMGTFEKIVPTTIFAYDGIIGGENAFIVAKQEKKYYNSIMWIICPPTKDEYISEDIFLAFEAIVDWKVQNSFNAVHVSIAEEVIKIGRKHGFVYSCEPCPVYYMDSNIAASIKSNENCPPNVALRKLSVDQAEILVKHWKWAQEGAVDEVRDAIAFVDSMGLLVSDELVSWAYASTDGAIHGLLTKEEFRGKGYGKLLLRALARSQGVNGLYPTTQVEEDNKSSSKLMTNSGFTLSHRIRWTEYNPILEANDWRSQLGSPN